MNVVRLPGIHHDGNVVLVTGSLGNLLINAGTSWYQALQVERITGQLGERPLDRIPVSYTHLTLPTTPYV